jgi:hypothetical protein
LVASATGLPLRVIQVERADGGDDPVGARTATVLDVPGEEFHAD